MRRELSASRMLIAVAVYLPEHYARLLATAEDASDLEPTWQEWHTVYQETRQKMAELGMHLIEVTVDLDDLEQYCQEQGLKNTSGTRAQYAAHVLSEQYPRHKQLQPRLKKKKHRTR
jgi:phosphoglycolate phosphatase-like HAD superfamily hydrolase